MVRNPADQAERVVGDGAAVRADIAEQRAILVILTAHGTSNRSLIHSRIETNKIGHGQEVFQQPVKNHKIVQMCSLNIVEHAARR